MCPETVEGAVFHVESNDTNTLAILHNKIECEVFNEEVCVVAKRLAVKRVEERMASTVSRSSASVRLATLAELQRLTTERALIDLALLGS